MKIKLIDENYKKWLSNIANQFKTLQIKAASSVNSYMLLFYYMLGRDIAILDDKNQYGSDFYGKLSKDLQELLPDVKSFSTRNIRYMVKYYKLFDCKNINAILPQLGAKLDKLDELPEVGENLDITTNLPQVGAEFLLIPWGHIKLLIDKCSDNKEKALFYIKKTLENNWSRAVLLNFLDTDLYNRQGKAITNFEYQLPKPNSDLAKEMTKDPYNFDFLNIQEKYNEKELKDALMNNIQKFLLELGTGFSFVGREYRFEVGNTEQYIDMLFYNILLKCYVVVEVKVREFKAEDMGQLSTYVGCINHTLKRDDDNQTLGILICKTKDNVYAKYSVETQKEPIAISEYELSKIYPKDFKSTLPSIEEIEKNLK